MGDSAFYEGYSAGAALLKKRNGYHYSFTRERESFVKSREEWVDTYAGLNASIGFNHGAVLGEEIDVNKCMEEGELNVDEYRWVIVHRGKDVEGTQVCWLELNDRKSDRVVKLEVIVHYQYGSGKI